MAGEQRKCATCRFFKDAGIAGNGWCTHPKRQLTTDAMLLVRAGELACRNSWGGDLFQSKYDGGPVATDPDADLPGNIEQPDSRDDQVTSVTIPPERVAGDRARDAEDRVVSDRPAPRRHEDDDDDPWNDAAHREQDERARIIARGARDALMSARKRHSSRNRVDRDTDESSTDPDAEVQHDGVVTHQDRFSNRRGSRFAGSTYGSDPVPRAEIESRQSTPPDRFDSVPEIDPSFDLPGQRFAQVSTPAPALEPEREQLDEEPEADTSYEHVLQRARRIREAKVQNHRPIRHTRRTYTAPNPAAQPLAVAPELPGVYDAPAAGAVDNDEPALPDIDFDTTSALPEISDESVTQEADPDALDDDPDYYLPTAQADHEPEADERADDDDSWYENDVPEHQPTLRRSGWLSRFGLRRQEPAAVWHDDAMVTRHANQEDEQDYEDDLIWAPEPEDDAVPYEESASWAPAVVTETEPDDLWRRDAQPESQGVQLVDLDDVVHDNALWSSDISKQGTRVLAPDPVPAARWRQEPMHRQRLARELPDLDDNLFEARFERSPQEQRSALLLERESTGVTAVADEPATVPRHESNPGSPARESYFRATRFRNWTETNGSSSPPREDEEHARRLPDLAAHDFDLRELVARGGELLDMTIDIAPDVPRECRTCRSFRSTDGGARGWCTNEWAFTHRRMVNEDDLACGSTIGCWWLPADRYWLIEEQDGYAATPRMDELIARRPYDRDVERAGASG